MADVTILIYQTKVTNGVVVGDSQLVELTLQDTNNDGIIDTKEWTASTGLPGGWLRGTGADDPSTPNDGPALWVGDSTGNTKSGTVYSAYEFANGDDATPLLSNLIQNKFSIPIESITVCFLAGTLIATPGGETPVEDLRAGDLVMTRDHGAQPLVWVGSSHIDSDRLDRNPNLRPVVIDAGALGAGMPRREVRVSPQHRILVTDADGRECLASARHLQAADAPGFHVIKDAGDFTLVHIAFADHQIVMAEGAAMESFFAGPMAVHALTDEQRDELTQVFPSIADGENPMTPARHFPKRKEVAELVAGMTRIPA